MNIKLKAFLLASAALSSATAATSVAQEAEVSRPVASYAAPSDAQRDDIYGERRDTLQAAVFTAGGNGNFISKGKEIRTEVITAAGLCKMACCNLAESFENSASVTVGYSDAITGARQIRLLGQNGIYTQMLDENRPAMRGLSAPFGLNYIPGQWLESIQIAKGVTSVINGVESMTGQINMEHRKPTDEKPLYLQASVMDNSKTDLNAISSIQIGDDGRWSTVLLGHADGTFVPMDMNSDGFLDDPIQRNLALSNRWLYYSPDGVQLRFGISGVLDSRHGGQTGTGNAAGAPALWSSDIGSRIFGAYLKAGFPLNEENTSNVALVADYTMQNMDGGFGSEHAPSLYPSAFRSYDATQHSAFANLLYQNQNLEAHHFTLGLSITADRYDESLGGYSDALRNISTLADIGAFGEYTFHRGDEFSAIVGLRADWYNLDGLRLSPRLTVKYMPTEQWILRFNGGRGLRYSIPITDNFGVLSTGKTLQGDVLTHILEDSRTFGGNITRYFGDGGGTYLSADFFHTGFGEQMLTDYGADAINFYSLSSLDGGYSYTNNLQVDFGAEPLPRLTVSLTGRITDARQTLSGQSSDIKPMTSLYKGVLNLQYATNLNKWVFDFTASVNGICRVWDFMKDCDTMYADGFTRAYPLLYAQITKRFKGFDIYVGGENLTGFRQPSPIIGADMPFSDCFDASCIWGPLMGASFYAGIRITVWKTEKTEI